MRNECRLLMMSGRRIPAGAAAGNLVPGMPNSELLLLEGNATTTTKSIPVVTKSPLPNLNLDPLESCSPRK